MRLDIPRALTLIKNPSDAPPLPPSYPNPALPTPRSSAFHISKRKSLLIQHFPSSLGQILPPFSIPPGVSQSPRLPLKWSLDDVGYDTVKKALGGNLMMLVMILCRRR